MPMTKAEAGRLGGQARKRNMDTLDLSTVDADTARAVRLIIRLARKAEQKAEAA